MKRIASIVCLGVAWLLSSAQAVRAESISNIQSSHPLVASLRFGEYVTLSFNYTTNEPGGVRVFMRPFSAGGLTPNYGASGSPLYPPGAGSGTASFTVRSGDVVVDHVRIQVTTADQSRRLAEFFVPVHYIFSNHSVFNIHLSPDVPSYSTLGEDVTASFGYATSEAGGVRIFIRPFSNGALTPNYGASGSPLYLPGAGSGTAHFTVTSGTATVDQLRIRMFSADQTRLLLEFFVPVNYSFAPAP
jgi:hypothetical protein